MKTLLVMLVLFTFLVNSTNAQHHDNVWIAADLSGMLKIDFSTGEPVTEVVSYSDSIVMEGGGASVANANGELQFYTNGCDVYNRRHRIMEGGAEINPGEVFDEFCRIYPYPRGYPVSSQGSLILPWPGTKDKYLLLHKALEFDFREGATSIAYGDQSLVTTIDMRLNDGDGGVTSKNVLFDSLLVEQIFSANKHANGIDWWVVSALRDTNALAVYLVNQEGIQRTSVQVIGNTDANITRGGQDVFTPLGDKFLRFSSAAGLEIFDFDR